MLNCLWIIGSGVYILYWKFLKKNICPICNGSQLEIQRDAIVHEDDTPLPLTLAKLANSSEKSTNDEHEKKVRLRQDLLQQNLKSAEHRRSSKGDVAAFQAKCEALTESRRLAVEQVQQL